MGARFSAFRLAVRRIFSESLPGAVLGKRTSRVISQQLDQAMRVMSVALIAQGAGAALLIASLWSAGPLRYFSTAGLGHCGDPHDHFFDRIQPPFLRG